MTLLADNSDTCLKILNVISLDPAIQLIGSYPTDIFTHLHTDTKSNTTFLNRNNIISIDEVLLNNVTSI